MEIDTNFQTPKEVCSYMASLVPEESINVLEPTPGVGNLVEALTKRGFSPNHPIDYFLMRDLILDTKWDCVVMNPPFSSKSASLKNAPVEWRDVRGMKFGYKMLLEMMSISDNIIALMPWFTISDSDVRLRRIKGYGLKSLTALPRKTFRYARIQTVILELEKGYDQETNFKVFEMLNCKSQISLLTSNI